MENKKIFETIGGLAKEECLFTLTSHIMPNTFVLENDEPYPGYHGENLPTDSKPISVFLITKSKYSTEKIFRLASKIKKYFDHPFDAVPGSICINIDTYPCIRIRNLDNYELVEELQKSFFSEGIKFRKQKNIRATGIIQLKKIFVLEQLEEGIYKDLDDPWMYYLQIPQQLSWQLFCKLTRKIRNNIDKQKANFDAGLASIYTREILDAVRIYAYDIDIDTLRMLRSKYVDEIVRMEHLTSGILDE